MNREEKKLKKVKELKINCLFLKGAVVVQLQASYTPACHTQMLAEMSEGPEHRTAQAELC